MPDIVEQIKLHNPFGKYLVKKEDVIGVRTVTTRS